MELRFVFYLSILAFLTFLTLRASVHCRVKSTESLLTLVRVLQVRVYTAERISL
jgi:hypothetical protein